MSDQPDADAPEEGVADDAGESVESTVADAEAEPDWKRRQRLAAVFGDAMPETTSDERDPAAGSDGSGETAGDRWLRSQVPPHHG